MASNYTHCVAWSPEDEQYVGTCVEFPLLSYLADGRFRAFGGILELVVILCAMTLAA